MLPSASVHSVFRNVFGDANALIRRELFLSLGGFTEDYGIGHEDWEFFARAALAGAQLYLVPEPLFWYRVDPRSMLRAGHARVDHARSVRPYREAVSGSMGAALALALHLQQSSALAAPQQMVATPETPVLGPIEKFLILRRAAGWRVALGRTFHYIEFVLRRR